MAEKRTFPMLGKWLTAHFTSERRGVRKPRVLAERRKGIDDRRFNSGLRLRGLELGFGLDDFRFGGYACCVTVLGDLQCFFISFEGIVQEFYLRVKRPK